MSAATEADGAVEEAVVEAGACAITRMCGHDDPYELVMHPASKSWEAPSMPRWQEWEEYSRAVLEAGAAVRPIAPGYDVEALRAEVVAPADLTSPEFGRNLFRAVIGESYTPHIWGNHRALHHTSVRFALDMADRSMPEVADVLRALIWQQVVVDNRAGHAFEAQRAAEDRATAAEADLAKARADALEEAAKLADEWAAENLRMATDSIKLDPALNGGDFSPAAQKVTAKMQAHGAHHAGAFAGCEQLAKAIRALTPTDGGA